MCVVFIKRYTKYAFNGVQLTRVYGEQLAALGSHECSLLLSTVLISTLGTSHTKLRNSLQSFTQLGSR